MKTTACNGSREIFRKSENRLSYIVPVSNDPWMIFTSHQEGAGCVAEEGGTGIRTLQPCWSLLRCGTGGGQRARKGHPKKQRVVLTNRNILSSIILSCISSSWEVGVVLFALVLGSTGKHRFRDRQFFLPH